VKAIAAGASHTVALLEDGSVVAWGANFYGQRTVPDEALSGVKAVAAGGYHTVALKTDGTVIAWGYNADGQTSVPVGLTGVSAIAAGLGHTVALLGTGEAASVSLTTKVNGTNLVLSWPTSATGFRLQTKPSLSAPGSWSDFTGTPDTQGGLFVVTIPMTKSAEFYRLQKP
jgi:hypothetical protein